MQKKKIMVIIQGRRKKIRESKFRGGGPKNDPVGMDAPTPALDPGLDSSGLSPPNTRRPKW